MKALLLKLLGLDALHTEVAAIRQQVAQQAEELRDLRYEFGDNLDTACFKAASSMDMEDLADSISIDYRQLARFMDAADVASELDFREIAQRLDYKDLSDYVDVERVATHMSAQAVAHYLDLDDLAAALKLDNIDLDILERIVNR